MNRRTFLRSGIALSAFISTGWDKSRPLSVAIIGHTGRGNYGHGLDTLWLEFPELSIAGVADPDPKGLEAARVRLKGAAGFADYRKMLEVQKPDLLCIAPRHIDQHRDMALAACAAGVKGIYMEKPFCRTLSEADEILQACGKTGTKIALAHRNRYHPALATAQNLVETGTLGQVLEVRGRGKEDHRGGPLDLWVLGSHVLNLIPLFTGNLTACSAGIYQDGKPITRADLREGEEGIGKTGGNSLHARFESEKGIPVYIDSRQGAGVAAANFGFQVIGTKGIMDIRIDTEPLVHVIMGHPMHPVTGTRQWLPVTSGGINQPEPVDGITAAIAGHHAAVGDLLAAVQENRQPLCSGQEGRATVEAISAVFESHRLGGARVGLPLKTRGNPLDLL